MCIIFQFTVHSDLGRVVQAIVRELELRPPPLNGGTVSPPSSQRGEHAELMMCRDLKAKLLTVLTKSAL